MELATCAALAKSWADPTSSDVLWRALLLADFGLPTTASSRRLLGPAGEACPGPRAAYGAWYAWRGGLGLSLSLGSYYGPGSPRIAVPAAGKLVTGGSGGSMGPGAVDPTDILGPLGPLQLRCLRAWAKLDAAFRKSLPRVVASLRPAIDSLAWGVFRRKLLRIIRANDDEFNEGNFLEEEEEEEEDDEEEDAKPDCYEVEGYDDDRETDLPGLVVLRLLLGCHDGQEPARRDKREVRAGVGRGLTFEEF